MAEMNDGYTFLWDRNRLNQEEYIALGDAEIQGMQSGYFDAIAHPDRIFRRQKKWSDGMLMMSQQIIKMAIDHNIPLEQNKSSKNEKYHYWQEFWNQALGAQIIQGLDAHSVSEINVENPHNS